MTDHTPQPPSIDEILRRSLATPTPTLPADFHARILHHTQSQPPRRAQLRRQILTAYALAAAFTSATLLHAQGLSWPITLSFTLAPLALILPPYVRLRNS